MNENRLSLILRTTGNFILPLLLLFSLFLLLRGHNEPGGGFIAGLVAAAAISLHLFAMDTEAARRMLYYQPRDLLGWGLMLALASGLPAIFFKMAFFTSQWATFNVPIIGEVKVGTPLMFDIGVYLVVVGSVLTVILNLADNHADDEGDD